MLKKRSSRGIMLIEALVALIVVSLGILGVSKLQSHLIASSGDSKARAEATAIAEGELERLRNMILSDQYDGVDVASSPPIDGVNALFDVAFNATGVNDNAFKRVAVTVSWTDRQGQNQNVSLASNLVWEDPLAAARLDDRGDQDSGIRPPTGDAVRGEGAYDGLPDGAQATDEDISGTYLHERDDSEVELLDGDGNILLSLPSLDGSARSFVTIRGRVYFDDQASGSTIADAGSDDLIDIRLSSEGLCFNGSISGDPRGFDYICYVGPSWYGNVGVVSNVSGNAPKVCVGSPSVESDGTTTSFHATIGHARGYRGFRLDQDGQYWSTGVESGTHYPTAGWPRIADSGLQHQFLLTRSNQSCAQRMSRDEFSEAFDGNYGRHVCISPHASSASVICDELDIWPGVPGFDSGQQCLNTIRGGMYDRQGSVFVDIGDGLELSCGTGGQLGNRNFSCESIAATEGSELRVRNQRTTGNNTYCWETTVEAGCGATEIDFENAENDENIVTCATEGD